MSKLSRVIIDTDPGIDDVIAMLLALAAKPEDIEVLLISVTFGNVSVQNCLRNVVALFHVIQKEIDWRMEHGLPQGFEGLRKSKPLVAAGASKPLEDELKLADYYHGVDGLGGVRDTHTHLYPPETWNDLFASPPPDTLLTETAKSTAHADIESPSDLYTTSKRPSHLEILRILDENPPDTITIIAIGPLSNIALAASHSPKTLMRAKSVLVMGGAIDRPGNMSPLAEFNTYADTVAAARVFALTSPDPSSTMPPILPDASLPQYPSKEELGERRLRLILFPLDITMQHGLRRDQFSMKTRDLISRGSPLAEWVSAFMTQTFKKQETLHHGHEGESTSIDLHDPLTVWYALNGDKESDKWTLAEDEDIRVETAGQWSRGACIIDKRDRKRPADGESEVPGDTNGWLSPAKGNRLSRCIGTPGGDLLAPVILSTIFGSQ